MLNRNILQQLHAWRISHNRKPLIIRGSRQVGKTTVVQALSRSYQQYIYLNLERKEDAEIFRNFSTFSGLVSAIFFLNNKNIGEKDTLIFIDEIQEVPEALNLLRYFYEDYPDLHVIAAGSLLETILKEQVTIPVGRVQFMVVRPMSFDEFLDALGEKKPLEQYLKTPMDDFSHSKLSQLFHTYALIGGMPEIVRLYAQSRNLNSILPVLDDLISAYQNDVEKYARTSNMVQVIRHVMRSMGAEAVNRIKFVRFGHSNYGSKEVGEAMRTLEKAMLLSLIYPCTSTMLPLFSDKKKSPKLQLLDTGLLNHLAGIQKEIVRAPKLEMAFQGKVAEHIVGQELLARQYSALSELHFWTREQKGSEAEVDFIYVYDGHVIPVEVKLGSTGRLRSLHQFIDQAPHDLAVRFYGDSVKIDRIQTPSGKPFKLLNLPYFLAGRLQEYLDWYHSMPDQ